MVKADIRDIAKACAVSTATVSRVFNGKYGVSGAMRSQVIDAARAMNYTPKQAPAQHDVAMIIDQNEDLLRHCYRFRSTLLTRLLFEFFRNEMSVKIVNSVQSDLLLPGYAKTAILFLPESDAVTVTEKLRTSNIPVVLVNQVISGVYSVCSDHFQGMELATERLILGKHKKIGLILDNPNSWAGRERLRAYHETLKKHKLTPLPIQSTFHNNKSVVESLATLRSNGATGLILGGESMVEECVYMLGLLNISVPDDMSVISCEKEHVSQWLNPPHTTISQDIDDICAAVLRLVRKLVSGKKLAVVPEFLPSTLIERSSVKELA